MAKFRYVGPRQRPDGTVGVRYRGRLFMQQGKSVRLKTRGEPPHPGDTDEPECVRGGPGAAGATIIDVGQDGMAAAAFRNARGLGDVTLYKEIGP